MLKGTKIVQNTKYGRRFVYVSRIYKDGTVNLSSSYPNRGKIVAKRVPMSELTLASSDDARNDVNRESFEWWMNS